MCFNVMKCTACERLPVSSDFVLAGDATQRPPLMLLRGDLQLPMSAVTEGDCDDYYRLTITHHKKFLKN